MYCTTVQQDGTCFCSCCGRCTPNPVYSPPLYCETYSYDGAGCVAQRCFSHAPALMSARSLSPPAATCLPRRPMTKAQCDYQCSLSCPSMHDPTKCDCYRPPEVPANWCGCCSAETCSNTYCSWLDTGLDSEGQATSCACSCCGTCHLNFLYGATGKYCDTYGEDRSLSNGDKQPWIAPIIHCLLPLSMPECTDFCSGYSMCVCGSLHPEPVECQLQQLEMLSTIRATQRIHGVHIVAGHRF